MADAITINVGSYEVAKLDLNCGAHLPFFMMKPVRSFTSELMHSRINSKNPCCDDATPNSLSGCKHALLVTPLGGLLSSRQFHNLYLYDQ